jgi:beta-xylosidase
MPDRSDGTYANPVLFADYSDPDVVRVGDDFYLVASSFHEAPGLPILRSNDLVNWRIIGHAAERLPSPDYDQPRHGRGIWAPSIRHHDGRFWVFFGDPDLGLFVTRARDPRGPWEPLHLVTAARGLIDPCPLWDDDGRLYLVHAWAKSRAGFNGILTLRRLSPDGRTALDDGVTIFAGGERHPTIEGPKLYRRNGWIYIFAPAGGVKAGWQTVLRSRSILGPYEDRIVLAQGATDVNGPHQGALVDTARGESWFVHFQERGPYGRVTHLQPVTWLGDWPVIGEDPDGDGTGQPVPSFRKPEVAGAHAPAAPQTSDEFDLPTLGLQWQWNANPSPGWSSLTARRGALRLFPQSRGGNAWASVWQQPNVLVARFPAERFTVTALLDVHGTARDAASGLAVLGRDTASLVVARSPAGWEVVHRMGSGVDEGGRDEVVARRPVPSGRLHLRVAVLPGARLRLSTSVDGVTFAPIGGELAAREGIWVGARIALFTMPVERPRRSDFTDVEWFRIE